MQKLKQLLHRYKEQNYERWDPLNSYIEHIETNRISNFSFTLGYAKSLLESIGQEICKVQNQILKNDTTQNIIKTAFNAIGYSNKDLASQISNSLENIGKNIGEFRNKIDPIAHGKPMEELKNCNNIIDKFTQDLVLDSLEIIACFLIQSFESSRISTVPIPDGAIEKLDFQAQQNTTQLKSINTKALNLNKEQETSLFIASLLGKWNENSEGDKDIIDEVTNGF